VDILPALIIGHQLSRANSSAGKESHMTKVDIRHARTRIAQLREEAARETRKSARKELLLTASTIESRVERVVSR
jgi:tartrate dehydratase alpha subunit/fumarate hydratase class I-like protein